MSRHRCETFITDEMPSVKDMVNAQDIAFTNWQVASEHENSIHCTVAGRSSPSRGHAHAEQEDLID